MFRQIRTCLFLLCIWVSVSVCPSPSGCQDGTWGSVHIGRHSTLKLHSKPGFVTFVLNFTNVQLPWNRDNVRFQNICTLVSEFVPGFFVTHGSRLSTLHMKLLHWRKVKKSGSWIARWGQFGGPQAETRMALGMKAAWAQPFSLDPICWSGCVRFPQGNHCTQDWSLEGKCVVELAWVCGQFLGKEDRML